MSSLVLSLPVFQVSCSTKDHDVILRAAPERIVYVSCNPATQARDLALLDAAYRVEAVQPVDMFPHTHHVENVVLLERRE